MQFLLRITQLLNGLEKLCFSQKLTKSNIKEWETEGRILQSLLSKHNDTA